MPNVEYISESFKGIPNFLWTTNAWGYDMLAQETHLENSTRYIIVADYYIAGNLPAPPGSLGESGWVVPITKIQTFIPGITSFASASFVSPDLVDISGVAVHKKSGPWLGDLNNSYFHPALDQAF